MEVDTGTNIIEEGTIGAEEGGGDIIGALVVATPGLNKGVVNEGAATGPTKVACPLN